MTFRPLEEISLVCATSFKPLNDPILIDSQVVCRSFAALRQVGGELYRPSPTKTLPVIEEMKDEDLHKLKPLQSLSRALAMSYSGVKSTIMFHVETLSPLPSSPSPDLVCVGRDFLTAVRSANETDLITRGPLDLKSASVIAPQIVLDQEVYELPQNVNFHYNVVYFRVSSLYSPEEGVDQHVMLIFIDLRMLYILV